VYCVYSVVLDQFHGESYAVFIASQFGALAVALIQAYGSILLCRSHGTRWLR